MDYREYVEVGDRLMAIVAVSSLPKARQIRLSGVSRLYFEGKARDAWDKYWEIVDTVGRCPEPVDLEDATGFKSIVGSPDDDPFELSGQIAGFLAVSIFDTAFQRARDTCLKGDIASAIAIAETAVQRAKAEHNGLVKPTPFFEHTRGVIEAYERVKNGEMGIPYPWPSINEMTMGMWPGNMILFTARTGVGKTYVTLVIAANIYRKCKDVMMTYISPEMLEEDVVERFIAISERLQTGRLVRGTLDHQQEERLYGAITKYRPSDDFVIADRTKFLRARDQRAAISSMIDAQNEKAIRRGKRHLVIVDAAYKIGRETDQSERMIMNILWCVEAAINFRVPVLITSQLSRSAGSGGTKFSLETIGLTDVAGQEAHQAFALFRDDDMKARKEMGLEAMKVRRLASDGKAGLVLNWNFDTMTFTETTDNDGGYIDGDFSREPKY